MLLAMDAGLPTRYFSPEFWLSNPLVPLLGLFQLWMFVHALRGREWVWAVFIILGFGLAAVLYFFFVFRETPTATRGFELPGAHHRRRIKELQGRIHHLDKAHHHSQLADIYFQQGKLSLAEASYRAALERDPLDIDTRAHFGQCLLRQGRPAEARALLEGVIAETPKHDYGYSQMALAETLAALGATDSAMEAWKRVTESHSYPRAKVQLAELYLLKHQPDAAKAELDEVLSDDPHAPAFQRRRDRPWVRRARRLRQRIP